MLRAVAGLARRGDALRGELRGRRESAAEEGDATLGCTRAVRDVSACAVCRAVGGNDWVSGAALAASTPGLRALYATRCVRHTPARAAHGLYLCSLVVGWLLAGCWLVAGRVAGRVAVSVCSPEIDCAPDPRPGGC